MESTTKLYSLNYTNANTYLFAFVFIVGNVVLPQLCHLVHLGAHPINQGENSLIL